MTTTSTTPALESAISFDFSFPTRVVFGSGSLNQLGELVAEHGGSRVMLITDQGLAEAGHESRAMDSMKSAGLQVRLYDGVTPNPTTEDVDKAIASLNGEPIDFIVGLGGGSSMDCAKGVNFILTNGGQIQDYWGVGKATKPMLPFIAIPTTAGTGSEAQSFALIANAETHMKMACGDKKAAAKVALLDPELTLTMPKKVAAVTAVDALSHAVETHVTSKRNVISSIFSLEAWKQIHAAFPDLFSETPSLEARERMLLGAHWAGAAIEQSMLGATHALANPLTAHFETIHGIAVGIMLPHVIRFNSGAVGAQYGELAEAAGLTEKHDPQAAELLADFVTNLVKMTGLPTTLEEAGIDPGLFSQMSEEASKQWTGTFNPRPVNTASLQEIYQCAWS